MLRRTLLPLCLVAGLALTPPVPAQDAQEERDRGFIVALIEDNLASPGLSVRIDGFDGALSSRATLERLQVSDESGVWLTLENVVLDWNRSALLRGRLEVSELSAARIVVERAPLPAEGIEALPDAGASGFSLPNLPVSVQIDALQAERIELGAPLLGQEMALSLDASARLADGSGAAVIAAERLDGTLGNFAIDVAYDAAETTLAVDLDISEAAGGVAATLLQLPGRPAIRLTVDGNGPLDAFAADVAVASDGQERLAGQVRLSGTDEGRLFDVDLGGDVTALFAPRYQPFFGDDVALVARGLQRPDGRLDLQTLQIDTQALKLAGEARLGADGWPVYLDVTGQVEAADGTPVLLPTGEASTLRRADLLIRHDAAVSDNWTLEMSAIDYAAATVELENLAVSGSGILSRSDGAVDRATASLSAALAGLDLSDPDLATALGRDMTLLTSVAWTAGQPVRLDDLDLSAGGLGLTGAVEIDGTDPEMPLTISPDLVAQVADLSRLAGLAGLDLAGAGEITASGDYAPLAGTFDLALGAETRGLAIGIAQADAVLQGESALTIAARRTVDGTFVDTLRLSNDQILAEGSVRLLAEDSAPRLQGQSSSARLEARLMDGTVLDPRLNGEVAVAADLTQNEAGAWQGTLDAVAPEGVTLSASGLLTGNAPAVDFSASVPRIEPFAPGVPGSLGLTGQAAANDGIWSVDAVLAGPWDVIAQVSGPVTGPSPDIAFAARLPDLTAPVPALADMPALAGPVALEGNLTQASGIWQLDSRVSAPSDITLRARGPITGDDARLEFAATVPQVQDFVPAVEGRLDLDGALAKMGADWAVDLTARGPYDARVTAQSVLTRAPLAIGFTADLPRLAPLAPVPGGLSVSGEALQTETGWRVDVDGTGPYAATLDATAVLADGTPSVTVEGQIPDSSALAPQLRGPLNYDAQATQVDGAWRLVASVDGAQGLAAEVEGIATGPAADLDLRVNVANVAPFAPGLNGPLRATGRLFQQGGGWNLDADASGPLGSTLTASGVLTGAAPSARFSLAVPDIGPLVPDISGPLRVAGTARQAGSDWDVDIDVDGPSGTNAAVAGRIAGGGQLDLSVTGSAPLGLANAALAPQRLAGVAQFDLTVNGPPGLNAVSGTISTSGAALSIPSVRNGLEDINATVTLSNGQAQIALGATPQSGGRVDVSGPVTLSAPFNADLSAVFETRVEDPSLYTAVVQGDIRVNGPLTGGASIGGTITIPEAEIAVPSSGLTAVGELPEVTHLGAIRPVQRTLARAGQGLEPAPRDANGRNGPVYGLDITINAPGRIFVRGRGLDAELGGTLTLRGTTANTVTAGGFELVRGRIDILQQRFDLDEGTIGFAGGLVPNIRLVAVTETDTITASIVVEGPADALEVKFESTPDVPQEEIVAQIFFGRDLSQLSPLQALQLANSVATLAGRGNGGLLEKLRGNAGLDDLDVTTDDEGNVALRAGKYVSDNVYTDVQIDQNGDAAISLNLDVTPNLTVRGSTGANGGTSLGVFFEKDY
ncbi:translocation/assembly module TamB domain-containing protein [Jannaschia pohangensis]|uniref:Autotransporter secretion inner membrane protein TamB n=1 Tax=Jannaschia pohangensis TaxID=390807 RepID=A0A1I3JWE6_9RHOB|nr:translocation/assembly module TamB domain-containing protein [Jannaschia pohangensis]SFI64543.1 autotransporter secretion inner membrane protein TamB [Jannaschia pohangensis]